MFLGRLLLSVSVLCLITEGISEPQYALSTLAMLNSGDEAKVCVNIVDSTEPLDLTVVMEYSGKNTTIIEEDIISALYFQCNTFPIPTVTSAVPVAIIFSAIGKTTDMRERKTVVIKPNSNNCMFQMDKPIYKPGQKVLCRVVCISPQLKPVNEKFPAIYLQDPSRTKIAQWLNQEMEHGVTNFEFQLITDASPGSYIITAERESSYPLTQWFKVDQYVLPRFNMYVDSTNTLSVTSEELKFNVSAMYTYGEPVPGSVTVRYCKQPQSFGRQQNCFNDKNGLCSNMTGKLGPDGTYSDVIDMLSSFMRSSGREMSIKLDITVTEEGTGIQATESRYVWVTSQPASLQFDYESMNQYYKRGLNYPVLAKLTDERGQPISNQEIELEVDGKTIQTLITDSDGRVEYGMDTSNMVEANFTVKLSYKNPDQCYYSQWQDTNYPTAEYTAFRFYSESGSFLQLKRPKELLNCGQSYSFEVQYTMSSAGVGDGATKATFYYLIISRAKIVRNGQKDVDLSSSMNGSFSFDVTVSSDLAPSADIVVYAIMKKELIADTVNLNIEKCFQNQVSMAFSDEKGAPGSNVDVQLSADPESFCALRVIDSSLMILNPYEQFSADRVYSSLGFWYYGYNVGGFNVEDPEPPCEDPKKTVFYKGRYYVPVSSKSEGDTYNNLKKIGLVVGTSTRLRKPVVCDRNPPTPEFSLLQGSSGGAEISPKALSVADEGSYKLSNRASVSGASPVESYRTDFSETFMWRMLPLDSEGHASLSETVPDTITKWQGTAFCLSDEGGFGMTRYPANFTTFLPFFMELSLPYSFVRGETLVLIGVVHNYLEQCVKIQVTLQNSDAFKAVLKKGEQDACVCSNGRASYSWEIEANTIGEISFTVSAQTMHISQSCDGPNDSSQPPRKDTVVQTILVEPEGIRKELTSSNLVFAQNTNSEIPIQITPPDNVVQDSVSAYVTAIGDIVGLSLRNLQDLVLKPYGCAEQNLARMAPIPYVLEYLNITQQLTKEVLQKAEGYMMEGYYRHLGYIHGGAYNTFQHSTEQGNSWLTAYSFNTFEQCKKYIFIDEARQQQTLIWLENSQRLDNGCFKALGNLFSVQDTDNDLHYTAYLAVSLLESKYSLSKTLLEGALECLKNASKTEQKTYDQVVMLYAFTLAELWEYRDPLLDTLMKKAVIDGGTIHWEREVMPKRAWVPFFLPPFAPAEVEMTAYMLLSLAAAPSISQNDLTRMAQISIWLVRQVNSHGGFPSTQDTVVGLKALAAFAQRMYTPNSRQTVKVQKGNGEIANFDLNQDNRLVVQRQSLPDTSGDYSIDVSGTGWCLIQTTVVYNIPVPQENTAFSLCLKTSSDSCVNGVAYSFTLNVRISYQGQQNASNMAIVHIKMMSGYTADFSSLREMVNANLISKFEENKKGEVILYLDSVSRETIKLSFRVLMGQRVLNVKSSSGFAYSYYEPDENGYASYNHPCAEQI